MRARRPGLATAILLLLLPAAVQAQTRLVLTMPAEGGRAATPLDVAVSSFTHTIGTAREQAATTREAGSGLATGRRQHYPVAFTTGFAPNAVQFQQLMARGTVIPQAELRVAARAGSPAGSITLSNARVTSVSIEMLPDGEVVQRVELTYESFRVTAGTASHEARSQ